MSKFLTILLSALTIFSAQAKETITIIYPFSAADTMANWARAFAEESNKSQDKYQFLVDYKPGAGNTIAANHVLATPNTILYTSSAFFVRPVFYPNESYNVNDFKQLLPMCNAPLAVSSAKYKTWSEVPKDVPLNIGTSGLGVTTHLGALQVVAKYPNAQVVPFKSTNDAVLAAASDTVDLALSFMGEAEEWTKDGSKRPLYVLGITGPQTVNGRTSMVTQGFNKLVGAMSVPHHMLVPTKMPADKFNEIQKILASVAKNKAVLDSYKSDHCVAINALNAKDIESWHNSQKKLWTDVATTAKNSK